MTYSTAGQRIPVSLGKYVSRQIGCIIIDEEQATVFAAYEITYPAVTASDIRERYEVNKLSEGKQ